MPIIVNCTCGKTLKVDEKYRGKRATCPACGTSLTVVEGPQPTAAEPTPTPAPAEKKPKKASAAPAGDDANPFAVPPDDSLQKRFTRRSKMPWIIFGCFFVILLLGCAGGCGYGLWYKFKDNISEAIGKEKK